MRVSSAFFACAVLSLAGCGGGAKNLQSVKSADYTGMPHEIVAAIETAPSLDVRFKDALTDSVKRCGANLQFATTAPGQPIKLDAADSILTMRELAHQTSQATYNGANSGPPWTSMVRMEFTLTDVRSKKPVWKGQADFTAPTSAFHANFTPFWGDDLATMMQKDGLFAKCDFNRPKAAPVSPAAAK